MALVKQTFKNVVVKGENPVTGISSFPTMFSTLPQTNINFLDTSILSSANALNFGQVQNFDVWERVNSFLLYQRAQFGTCIFPVEGFKILLKKEITASGLPAVH